MKTIEQLKEQFASSENETTIHQKSAFLNLTDAEIRLLWSIPDIKIHCTEQALKFIETRRRETDPEQKEKKEDGPPEALTADRAKRILDNTINNPGKF